MALRPTNPGTTPSAPVSRDEAQQEGFMREVDEALRQDQAIGLFKSYAKPVGLAIVAGLALFGAYLGWQQYRDGQRADRAEKFISALDQLQAGNFDKSSALLAPLIKEGGSGGWGNQAAALMLRAGIAEQQGKTAEAASEFGQVAANSDAPQPFRDLAKIRQTAINFDKMKPEDVVAAMKPLAVSGNPWFGSAGELLGIAYMKQGRNDLAGPIFAAISRDKTVPDTLRLRSRQMAGLLGVDAVDDVKQAAQDTAAGAAQGGPAQDGPPQGGPAQGGPAQGGQAQRRAPQ